MPEIMRAIKVDRLRDEKENYGYEAVFTLDGAQTTAWYLFPAKTALINITITPSPTGSGYIETTKDSYDNVVNDRTTTGRQWPDGNVSIETNNLLYPVTAWRAVCTSGVITVSAVAR